MAGHWLAPGQFREVVQIGAVRLQAATLAEEAAADILIRPRLNPRMSGYFETLTGISNARLAQNGVDFLEGYTHFLAFAAGSDTFAFGRDDLIFGENIRLYGLRDLPPSPRYGNAAPWLRSRGLNPRHAGDVAELAGVELAGQKHDALFDARSVAAGIRALVNAGAPNPFLDGSIPTNGAAV